MKIKRLNRLIRKELTKKPNLMLVDRENDYDFSLSLKGNVVLVDANSYERGTFKNGGNTVLETASWQLSRNDIANNYVSYIRLIVASKRGQNSLDF